MRWEQDTLKLRSGESGKTISNQLLHAIGSPCLTKASTDTHTKVRRAPMYASIPSAAASEKDCSQPPFAKALDATLVDFT